MQDGLSATPARRGGAVEQVVQRIGQDIVDGRYAAGQRLVARQLTDTLGFGRGTVREAFGMSLSQG